MIPHEFPHFEIEFDSKGKCNSRSVNFDPYADKAMTVSILKKQLADVEQQESSPHQTDKILTRLAKEKTALKRLIESFSAGTSERVGSTSRIDKRMAKKLRRKAARFEQGRK